MSEQPVLLSEFLERRGVDVASLPVISPPQDVEVLPRPKPKRRYGPAPRKEPDALSRWILGRRIDGATWADILAEYNERARTPIPSYEFYGKLKAEDRGLLRQRIYWQNRPTPQDTPANFYWHERGLTKGS